MATDGIKIDIDARDRATEDLKKVARRLKKLQDDLDDAGKAAVKASKQTKKAGDEIKEAGEKAEKTGKKTKKAGEEAKGAGVNIGRFGAAALSATLVMGGLQVATDLAAGALRLSGDAASYALDQNRQLEAQLVRTAAVTDGSAASFDIFRESATSAALDSKFAALEAAEALGFMGMAGFTAAQSTEALPHVLRLSAASMEDLGTTASLTVGIMAGYGKGAEEMAHINDVLVGTFTSTKTTLGDIGQAFKFVGPVAKAAGQDFELMAASIGLLGNANIDSTMAGRSLRMSLLRLQKPPKEAAEALAELGVQTMNANGELRRFDDILRDLQDAGATGSQLNTIFGTESVASIQALLEQGPDALTRMVDKLTNGVDGVAAALERLNLDTYNGQLEISSGLVSNLATDYADLAGDIPREVVRSFNLALREGLEEGSGLRQEMDQLEGALLRNRDAFIGVATGGSAFLIASLERATQETHEFITAWEAISGVVLPNAVQELSATETTVYSLSGALGGVAGLTNSLVPGLGTQLAGAIGEVGGEALIAAEEVERLAGERGLLRLKDNAIALVGRLDDVAEGFRHMTEDALNFGEKVVDGLFAQGEASNALSRYQDAQLAAARATTDAERARAEALVKRRRLDVDDVRGKERQVKLAEIQRDLEEKLARIREQAAKERAKYEKEALDAERVRLVSLAKIAELEAKGIPFVEAAATYQREMLEIQTEAMSIEERKLATMQAEYDLQQSMIATRQAANDDQIRALQEQNALLEERGARFAREAEALMGARPSNEVEIVDLDEVRRRRAAGRSEVTGALTTGGSQIAREGLAGLGQERLDAERSALEGIQGRDTSGYTEAQQRQHEQLIALHQARIEAIEEENAHLDQQLALYGQIADQTGVLGGAIAELAAQQWSFAEASDSVNAALNAGVSVAGAALEAAGLGVKQRAKWMAAFEAAAAIAAGAAALAFPAAAPTYIAAAAQHGIAAAQFGLIAGGVIGSSSGAGASAPSAGTAGVVQGADMRGRADSSMEGLIRTLQGEGGGGDVIYNIDFGSSYHMEGKRAAVQKMMLETERARRDVYQLGG